VKPDSKSSYASCFDATNGKYVPSQTVRTKTLVSPDGRYRAYAESISLRSPGSVPECSNTSSLFVAGPEKSPFRVVLTVKPAKELHGNCMQLIDWSPAGHVLLFSQGQWEWGSNLGAEDIRTYDAHSGVLSRAGPLGAAFNKHFARRCAAVFKAQGFSAESKVIVTAKPWFDLGDEVPAKESCSDKVGRWSIDFASGGMKPVEDGYKVEHRANSIARAAAL
jgi:dipeptidyl aminopeptidase/acylaminoacyl peptidase